MSGLKGREGLTGGYVTHVWEEEEERGGV